MSHKILSLYRLLMGLIVTRYDGDPSYEKIDDVTYRDKVTGDCIILVDDETARMLLQILNREPDGEDEIRLTKEEFDGIFEPYLDDLDEKSLYNSDLTELN